MKLQRRYTNGRHHSLYTGGLAGQHWGLRLSLPKPHKTSLPCTSLLCTQDDMKLQRSWYINGRHYSLTLEAWLARMDAQRAQIMPIMQASAQLCPARVPAGCLARCKLVRTMALAIHRVQRSPRCSVSTSHLACLHVCPAWQPLPGLESCKLQSSRDLVSTPVPFSEVKQEHGLGCGNAVNAVLGHSTQKTKLLCAENVRGGARAHVVGALAHLLHGLLRALQVR